MIADLLTALRNAARDFGIDVYWAFYNFLQDLGAKVRETWAEIMGEK